MEVTGPLELTDLEAVPGTGRVDEAGVALALLRTFTEFVAVTDLGV